MHHVGEPRDAAFKSSCAPMCKTTAGYSFTRVPLGRLKPYNTGHCTY